MVDTGSHKLDLTLGESPDMVSQNSEEESNRFFFSFKKLRSRVVTVTPYTARRIGSGSEKNQDKGSKATRLTLEKIQSMSDVAFGVE